MAIYYFDTSALVKRYAQETGTNWVLSLTDPTANNDLYTVRLTGPEMIAALFRKVRIGDISQTAAVRCAGNFKIDWQQQYRIIEANAEIIDQAMDLAEKHQLRGYDAVHLSAALRLENIRLSMGLPNLIFLSADQEQLQVAAAEGLLIENPNNYEDE